MQTSFSYYSLFQDVISANEELKYSDNERFIKRKIQNEYLFKWEFQSKSLSGLIVVQRKSKEQQYLQIEINKLQYIKNQMAGQVIYTDFRDHYLILRSLYKDKVFLCKNIITGLIQVAKFCDDKNNQERIIGQYLQERPNNNILLINELFEENGKIVLISDYYESGTLQDYFIKQNVLTLIQIKSIMKGILSGLKHLHENNVMHRDIKLTNIMIEDLFDLKAIKIIDFEYATFFDKSTSQECGTEGYKAPEMIKKLKYNEKCDIYSAGIIFYILLFGKRPNKIMDIDIDKIGFLSEEKSSYQVALDLLKQMLQEDPINRISAVDCLKHKLFQKTHNQSGITESIEALSSIKFRNPFKQCKSI